METPKVTRLLNPFAASLPVALDPGNLSTFHLGTTDGGWQVSEQGFALETNHGVIRQADCRLLHVAATPGKTVAVYRWQDFTISLHVEQADADAFFRTWLGIVCSHGSYELLGVTLLDALVAPVPYEVLEYRTFVNAPTVAFLRGGSAGVFLGIENPFFVCHHEGNRLCLSYAPAMTVSEGDTHTTEALFIGSTARTGKSVAETSPGTNWTPRFHNPSGEVPLDWGEIEAMRAYVSRYMRGRSAFSAVFYRFWHPHEPWLQTAQDAQKLCRELDTFAQMGGDAVIFLPFGPLSLPDGRPGACWKLAESPLGEEVLAHARQRGLRFGFYMGVANRETYTGNAAMAPYRPDRPEWKKVDAQHRTLRCNCLACNDYADWFIQVQDNTIKKHGLSIWSWDPGPGDGDFCYAGNHGHLPGQGGYRGWRNRMRVMAELKRRNPGLELHAYYGLKEDGIWSLRDIDNHECYTENLPLCGSLLLPDVHVDRLIANDVRFQGWWSAVYRFLPMHIAHGAVHRSSHWGAPEQVAEYVDDAGWRYSLLSAIATCANVCLFQLPPRPESLVGPDYVSFFREWLDWARSLGPYHQATRPISGPPRVGAVDAYAKVIGDHGYLFLCNPNPRPVRYPLELGTGIGVSGNADLVLEELYPQKGRNHGRVYRSGETAELIVPAHTVLVLRVGPHDGRDPLLFGVAGNVRREEDRLTVLNVRGPEGSEAGLSIWLDNAQCIRYLSVNGTDMPFTGCAGRSGVLSARLRFAGEALNPFLDDWTMDNGRPIMIPNAEELHHPVLTTRFRLPHWTKTALAARAARGRTSPLPAKYPFVNEWGRPEPVWSEAERLALVLPATYPERMGLVRAWLNDEELPVNLFALPNLHGASDRFSHWVDLTEVARFGGTNLLRLEIEHLAARQFLGPYLENLPSNTTAQVSSLRPDAPRTGVVTFAQPPSPEPRQPDRAGPKLSQVLVAPPAFHVAPARFTLAATLEGDVPQGTTIAALTGQNEHELTWNPETARYEKEASILIGRLNPFVFLVRNAAGFVCDRRDVHIDILGPA